MEKYFVIFQPRKVLKKTFFWSVITENEDTQTSSFDIHFHIILFKIDLILLMCLYLTAVGHSFGNVRSGKSPENVWKSLEKVWKFIFKIA